MIFDDIDKNISLINGHLGYYFIDLINNETHGYNENDEFLAASVIKFPIYCIVYKLVYENKISFDKTFICRKSDKLPSCGGLNCFENDIEIDLKSLCNLMIRLSDNTATNMIIKYIGIDTLNNEFKLIGLNKTHIYRLLFDGDAKNRGLENIICLSELGNLFKQLFEGLFINKSISDDILDCMSKQQIRHKIPGYLNHKYRIANKTGEDDYISNDVALVFTKKPFVLCFASNNCDTTEAEIFIRTSSKIISDYMDQL